MPWNGTGVFSRIYSWVADKAAGIDISSTRMDTDSNDIVTSGLGNCITRDGQGQPTANLPMANFRHTGVGNGVAASDYASLGQAQNSLSNWVAAGGTADAITATYSPAVAAVADGQLFFVRASAANATTAPTFSPNGLGPYTITKNGGAALAAADIDAAAYEAIFRFNLGGNRMELMNPSTAALAAAVTATFSTGDVKPTYKTSADSGWILMNDNTIGSATSGSNFASSTTQALFTLLYNSIGDADCPILTSGGAGTNRASQGTAAQAWTANCRMTLPKILGRAMSIAGAGSGVTLFSVGQTTGSNSASLITANLPNYTPTGSVSNGAITSSVTGGTIGGTSSSTATAGGGSFLVNGSAITVTSTQAASTFTGASQGGSSQAFSIMQPASFLNVMIKL